MDNKNKLIIKKMQSEINIIAEIIDGIDFEFFISDEKIKQDIPILHKQIENLNFDKLI